MTTHERRPAPAEAGVEALVLGWARHYTRGLPARTARRRVDELRSDCHEHRAWGREVGASRWAVSVSMASRALAGMPADLHWRHTQLATVRDPSPRRRGRPMGRWTRDNWWLVLAVPAAVLLLVTGVGLPLEDRTLGAVLGGALHLAAGLVMVVGMVVRRRPGRRRVGDLMIGLATIPLLMWLWTIVMPLLALAVMIGAFRDAVDAEASTETTGSARPA